MWPATGPGRRERRSCRPRVDATGSLAPTGVLAALAAVLGAGRVHQHPAGHRLTADARAGGQAPGSTMTFRPVRAAAAAIASGALVRPNRPVTREPSSTRPPEASPIARG